MMAMFRALPLFVVTESLASFFVAAMEPGEPTWMIVRELGSFGLVAILIWYFVKYALPQQRQDYLAAEERQRAAADAAVTGQRAAADLAVSSQRESYISASKENREAFMAASAEQRTDFMKASTEQRIDFLGAIAEIRREFLVARSDDRAAMREMTISIGRLADATFSHVKRAEDVWAKQEEKDKRVVANET